MKKFFKLLMNTILASSLDILSLITGFAIFYFLIPDSTASFELVVLTGFVSILATIGIFLVLRKIFKRKN